MFDWFANPALLWLGLLALPVILLFMLRHRPVVKRVPTTLLWSGAAQLNIATSPFSPLRRSLSLLLMLLLLLCLVLALAGLRIPDARSRGLPLVVVIDTTASMQTRTPDGSRLEVAVSRAQELISAAGDCEVTVLTWNGALLLASPTDCEPAIAKRALRNITPSDQGASDEALLLALKPQFAAKRKQRVALISDHRPGDVSASYIFVPAGAPAANSGIVAADLSDSAQGQADLFFGVEMCGEERKLMTVKLERMDEAGKAELADARDVALISGQRAPISFRVAKPGLYRARLETEDALAADNTAYLRYTVPEKLQVAFVGNAPKAVSEIVEAIGSLERVDASRADASRCAFVYAQPQEQGLQRLPSAWLGPAALPANTSCGKPYDASDFAARLARSFLWRGAGVPDIRIGHNCNIETRGYLQPLMEAGNGVSMGLVARDDSPLSDLVVGFDLDHEKNNFRSKYAFVIFWTNWFEYVRGLLEPLPRGACRSADSVSVIKLSGRSGFSYAHQDDEEKTDALPGDVLAMERTGVYRFEGLSETAVPLMGVSLLDPTESNTAFAFDEPYSSEAIGKRLDEFSADAESARADYDLRPWLALLGLSLLLFDWFWFRRRFPLQAEQAQLAKTRRGVTALRKRKAGA